MSPPDLQIHSIRVGHTVAPNSNGQLAPAKQLTYHVGDHGPFVHTYHDGTGTADKMISDMHAQKAEITALHQATG
jgi:hypothetical protein